MTKRERKDKLYGLIVQLVKAMANPHRLEIIDLIGHGEFSVEQIADEVNLSVANASQHLQLLKKSNLVKIRREGNFIYYTLSSLQVYQAWLGLRNLAQESVADLKKVINISKDKLVNTSLVTLPELLIKLKNKEVVLLDIRPANEYAAGHIPHAINIPISELKKTLPALDKRLDYVAYCRGSFCVFADEAVALLVKNGYKAVRLYEGFPEYALLSQSLQKVS